MGGVYTTSSNGYFSREPWTGKSVNGWYIGGSGSSGSGSGGSSSQQQFPTSAYGQTIPVIWGAARVPGAYIWAPDVIVKTTTTGAILQTTTVTVNLSARIRFARPLVADSRWSLRRLWADGSLIIDKSTGYRKSGINIREYDGHSSQGRDPTMTSKEGTNNVSAHRGYLDIVIRNYNLGTAGAPPPAFEAEWIQEDTGSIDVDVTSGFFSDPINTYAAADWDTGTWWGITTSPDYVRRFDIGTNQEIYAVPLTGLLVSGITTGNVDENSLRYIPEIDRLLAVDFLPGFGNGAYPCIINPETGAIIDHAAAIGPAGEDTDTLVTVMFGNKGVLLACSDLLDYFAVYTFNADTIERVYQVDWGSDLECFAVGEVRASDADVYVATTNKVQKIRISSNGGVLEVTGVYTDADTIPYIVFHDDGIIAWNDNDEVMRINVATGAVEWTEATPYTMAGTGALAPPDCHRLDGDILIEGSTSYWFTDLDTGETTTVSKTNATVGRMVYDGEGRLAINTDRTVEIARRTLFDAAGDGDLRDLEDFLSDLMVAGGFDASEVEVENVDDQVRGAVIDITGGVRDIARQVCEPYSIAIFERAGQIIFRRALTDGSFAVEASIGSTDILDAGGQAIRLTRQNPNEFVAKYGINYRDHEEIYQPRPQWGVIPSLPLAVAPTEIGIKADIPIISDADTIKALATKRVYRGAVEKHQFDMEVRAEHLKVEPETIVQFTVAGRLVTARVLEQTIRPNFTNSIVATEFLSSVAVAISGASGRPVEPEPIGSTQSRYYHLDIPLLTDTDDLVGAGLRQYHVLASSGQLTWAGATLFRKDGTGTYLPQTTQIEDGLVLIALEELPDVDIPYVTEFTRTLSVARVSGDADLLTSITYNEMLAGGNMFAIGQPGRWEVCHVQTITDNGDNTYTFETLRRGRGTSEEFTGLHEVGDRIVWLSEDNVQSLEYTIASLDDAFDFKAVGVGGSLSATPTIYTNTVTGEAEKIPKPCHLDAVIDGADIDLAWVRRSRIGSYWADDGDDTYTTPLGESLEQYVIRIKDGPAGAVLRTVTVDNATAYTYSAANITTDFGSMPDDLTYDIRQVSGTGVICPTREETITL